MHSFLQAVGPYVDILALLAVGAILGLCFSEYRVRKQMKICELIRAKQLKTVDVLFGENSELISDHCLIVQLRKIWEK